MTSNEKLGLAAIGAALLVGLYLVKQSAPQIVDDAFFVVLVVVVISALVFLPVGI